MMTTFEAEFHDWLSQACLDSPPESVVAYNICLFESPDGFKAYLVGANEYSEDNDDWACDETFTPKRRYFQIPRNISTGKDWREIQSIVIEATKSFLISQTGTSSFLARAQAITVGFDDGDLHRRRFAPAAAALPLNSSVRLRLYLK